MSAVLNGTDQAFRVSSQFGLGDASQSGWAISAMFKRSRIDQVVRESIAARGNAGSSTSYGRIQFADSGNVLEGMRYAGATDTFGNTVVTSTSEWNHAVVYFPPADGVSRTCRLWVNGAQNDTATSTRSSTSALDTFYIGRTGGTINLLYFGGKVAHVTLLQGEPTLAEAALLATKVPSAITFDSAVPLAYWSLHSDGTDQIGSFDLEAINSPTFDTGDHPEVSGGDVSEAPFLIIPRRQLFVTRRVIQH